MDARVAIALNPAQARAVEHFRGPMLVLAGAGSGKTRVITERIARLIERGVMPQQIVALTFTNKAAREMHERVELRLRQSGHARGADGLTVSTFHSYGLATLSARARVEKRPFTIFDQGDQLALVKELLVNANYGRSFDASAILARISHKKNRAGAGQSSAQELDRFDDEYTQITEILFPRYQAALKGFSAYDFDDLVCEVSRLWREHPEALEQARTRARFLLVDEYQDTNPAQFELLRLLAGNERNLFVVGDDDQAIYSWRGADVKNILQFEQQFAGAEVVKLEENYRSLSPILAVANAVISKKTQGHQKTLFTSKKGGELPTLLTCPSPEEEASWISQKIVSLIKTHKVRPKEIAILYRSNSQAKAFEENLRAEQIPYRVVGGQQFFERKEVKDLIAYLKFALNRADEISLRRVINTPARGVGETSLERLTQAALSRGWSLWQAIERVDALDGISTAARAGCKELERVIAEVRRDLLIERLPGSVAAERLLARIDMRREIDSQSGSSHVAARRWGNLQGLIATLKRRENKLQNEGRDASGERDFAAFLHALSLQPEDENEGERNQVTLSTLHGAKGLEFDHVYFVGCEEGIIPHTRTTEARATDLDTGTLGSEGIDEERRLFYVGVTRARAQLTISVCKQRAQRGKPAPRSPSRFVQDIPEQLLCRAEAQPQKLGLDELSSLADDLLAALMPK